LTYNDRRYGDNVIDADGRCLLTLLTPVLPLQFPDADACLGFNVAHSGVPDTIRRSRQTALVSVNRGRFEIIDLRMADLPDQDLKYLVADALAVVTADNETDCE
jgi:hypothetical protein